MTRGRASWRRLVLKWGISVGVLLTLARVLDLDHVLTPLGQMQARWVALALALSVVQHAVSAWRWRFTASRLGLDLPFRRALAEYYVGGFLNQILPGGVLGDVSRAWRHARSREDPVADLGVVVRAVILERASGQIVMTGLALGSVFWLVDSTERGVVGVIFLAVCVGAAVVRLALRRRRRLSHVLAPLGRFWEDTQRAVLSRSALPQQIISSLVVVSTYVATFLIAGRAVGVSTPVEMAAPVLFSMVIPVTVAGWGVRELVAASLWGMVGLRAEDGVVVSVAYGLIVLASTLPGGLVMLVGFNLDRARGPDGGQGQTTRRHPDKNGDMAGEEPR